MISVVAVLCSAATTALLVRPPLQAHPRRRPARRRQLSRAVTSPTLAGVSAALAVLLLLPMPVAAAVAPAAGVIAARMVARLEPAAVRCRRAQLEGALPSVVDLMSTSLAAGASPSGALGRIAEAAESPMCDELSTFAARLALGADPGSVWASMASHPQLGSLGRAIHRSSETGASVAEALARLSSELREGRRAQQEALARTVEVKASIPLGLCLLPAFVLIGIVPMIVGSFSSTFLGM